MESDSICEWRVYEISAWTCGGRELFMVTALYYFHTVESKVTSCPVQSHPVDHLKHCLHQIAAASSPGWTAVWVCWQHYHWTWPDALVDWVLYLKSGTFYRGLRENTMNIVIMSLRGLCEEMWERMLLQYSWCWHAILSSLHSHEYT